MMKIFFCILLAFHLTLPDLICAEDGAPAPADAAIVNLEIQVLKEQKKVNRLQQSISEHKDNVKVARNQEINLLGELEKVDQTLEKQRNRLVGLRNELQTKEELIKQKVEELSTLTAEKTKSQAHVAKRLVAFYRMGDIGMLNIIFSSSSLPELLNFHEYFEAMINYDQKILDQYRQNITKLSETNEELLKEKTQLLNLIVEQKNNEKALAATRKERMALLSKVNTEKKLYQRALEEMRQAARDLNDTIDQLKNQVEEEKSRKQQKPSSPKKRRPDEALPGLAALKGKLDPPVQGSITTYFGNNTNGKFGITTYANGVDIKTATGAEVKAIYDGKIVYAGSLRGYGNLVIIDHGEQFYSLVSRLATLLKKEGDIVSAGEIVGIMHDQEGLLGEGLHFEIRHGTEPENPLDWINTARLKINSSKSARK